MHDCDILGVFLSAVVITHGTKRENRERERETKTETKSEYGEKAHSFEKAEILCALG